MLGEQKNDTTNCGFVKIHSFQVSFYKTTSWGVLIYLFLLSAWVCSPGFEFVGDLNSNLPSAMARPSLELTGCTLILQWSLKRPLRLSSQASGPRRLWDPGTQSRMHCRAFSSTTIFLFACPSFGSGERDSNKQTIPPNTIYCLFEYRHDYLLFCWRQYGSAG